MSSKANIAIPPCAGLLVYKAYKSGNFETLKDKIFNHNLAQWKFSGDKHKSLQVDTERTFHQRYPLAML